jgi:hypothetical protein
MYAVTVTRIETGASATAKAQTIEKGVEHAAADERVQPKFRGRLTWREPPALLLERSHLTTQAWLWNPKTQTKDGPFRVTWQKTSESSEREVTDETLGKVRAEVRALGLGDEVRVARARDCRIELSVDRAEGPWLVLRPLRALSVLTTSEPYQGEPGDLERTGWFADLWRALAAVAIYQGSGVDGRQRRGARRRG